MPKVKAFGLIAEITGTEFYLNADDVTALQTILHEKFPNLEGKKFAIAVNRKIITGEQPIADGDEIALMPPYSGG